MLVSKLLKARCFFGAWPAWSRRLRVCVGRDRLDETALRSGVSANDHGTCVGWTVRLAVVPRAPLRARRPRAARRPHAACATSPLVRRLRPIVSAPSAARRLHVACAPPVRTAAACAPDAHPRVLAESSAFSLFQPGVHETGLCDSVFLTTCITRCVECDLKKKRGCILTRHFRRCYSSFTVLDGSRWG